MVAFGTAMELFGLLVGIVVFAVTYWRIRKRNTWLKQEHLIAEIKRYETSPMYEGFPFAAVYAIIRSGDQEHLIQLLLNLDDPFSFSWDDPAFLIIDRPILLLGDNDVATKTALGTVSSAKTKHWDLYEHIYNI